MWLALLVGISPRPATRPVTWTGRHDASSRSRDHFEAYTTMLDALVETGDLPAALEMADAYERRSMAWTGDRPLGMRMRIAFLRHHAPAGSTRPASRARAGSSCSRPRRWAGSRARRGARRTRGTARRRRRRASPWPPCPTAGKPRRRGGVCLARAWVTPCCSQGSRARRCPGCGRARRRARRWSRR